jgi:cell fate regulator YaaT (PSP1 superfamily)
MLSVVGVRFRQAGKIYYFDPNDLVLRKDQAVIVETVRGIEFGTVVIGIRHVTEEEVVLPLRRVLRIATPEDVKQMEKNLVAAREALSICEEKIQNHDLEMKLVDAEYTFDRNKIIFYFTADGRVDFRELVRDLASVFRTRIELRQIGVRDEAKMLGGIGPCGRVLCCSSFLGDFEPVSIKMAKDQNLSLNPAKISGLCGRLMCCLKFENDTYVEAKQMMPDIGTRVTTPEGVGRVVVLNLLERRVQVELADSGRRVEHPAEVVKAQA